MAKKKIDRRTFIKGAGAAGIAASSLGFPAVVRGAAMKEVEIAVIYPLSGPSGASGTNAVRGWNIAVDEINGAGGIKCLGGAKIKTVLRDTQTTPRVGMAEYEKVAQNKNIPLLVGSYNSNVTYPSTQVSEQYGLPQLIGMASQATILEGRNFKYVFRTILNSRRMGTRMVDFVEAMGKKTGKVAKRAALLSLDENFGKSSAKAIIEAIQRGSNQKVVADLYNPLKVTNVDVEVAKLKAAKPDVIYLTNFTNDAILVTRALAAQKVDTMAYVTFGAGYVDPKYLSSVGKLSEYMIAITKFDYDLNRPMEQAFEAKMKKQHGVSVNHHSASLYAMAYIVKDVLERACTTDRNKVRDAIAATNITSGNAMMMPGTSVKFGSDGEVDGAADIMAQVLKGKYRTVWPGGKLKPVWPMPKWSERA